MKVGGKYRIFYILWILSFLIYPAWALPVNTSLRFFVFSGLFIYFLIAKRIMSEISIDVPAKEPFIFKIDNVIGCFRNNMWFFIVSVIAVIYNIIFIFSPIRLIGDEALHLQGGLWVYDYLGREWHHFFRALFAVLVITWFLLILKKDASRFPLDHIKKIPTSVTAITLVSVLFLYFLIFRDIIYDLYLVRYPPLLKFLYLFTYFIVGITHHGPRILQLFFYLLTAFYIYRIINLYLDRTVSILGAIFYLFTPLPVYFARTAEIASGLTFFITIISFYFLRYLKMEDRRDLILIALLIGTGFLYKRDVFLMFFICSAYLLLHNMIKKRDFLKDIIVLLFSLIPIIPWMAIGYFLNWRNYSPHWLHLFSSETIFKYLELLNIQLLEPLLVLFLISLIYNIINKKDGLSSFFGLLFIALYLFYTLDYTVKYNVHRFSLSLYPSISIFLSYFIYHIGNRVSNRKYFYWLIYISLIIYLSVLNLSTPLKNTTLGIRTLEFPSAEAMEWVKDNIKEDEKILILRIQSARFYKDKFDIQDNRVVILWYDMYEVLGEDKLRNFLLENKITHIMFPYSVKYPYSDEVPLLRYLKNNRYGEFTKVSEFRINENYIYIYKVKEISTKEDLGKHHFITVR